MTGLRWANVSIGADELSEPFQCWTDGAFALTPVAAGVVTPSPVPGYVAPHHLWAGESIDTLVPVYAMDGLEGTTHELDGRAYDALGWWPYGIHVDSTSEPAVWTGFFHTENGWRIDHETPGDGSDLRTVGAWRSWDEGREWTYLGPALSIYPPRGPEQTGWPRVGGTGDHTLVVGHDDYLYILYTQFTYDNPVGMPAGRSNSRGNLAVARAPKAGGGASGDWQKYYNGGFTEPGIGGHETYVMSKYVHGLPDNGQRAVTWSSYLKCYVMVFASVDEGVFLAYSDDLVAWSEPQYLYQESSRTTSYGDGSSFIAYVALVDAGLDPEVSPPNSTAAIGRQAWFYYVVQGRNYEVRRRLVTFDTDYDLALWREVTASANYGFGIAGNVTDGTLSSEFQPDLSSDDESGCAGWLTIDLGSVRDVNEVRLWPTERWGWGFPLDVAVGLSVDGEEWREVLGPANAPAPRRGETRTLGFDTASGRYVRLTWARIAGSGEAVRPFRPRLTRVGVFCVDRADRALPQRPSSDREIVVRQASRGFSPRQGAEGWTFMFQSSLDPEATFFHWAPLTFDSSAGSWGLADSAAAVDASTMTSGTGERSGVARVWRARGDGVADVSGSASGSGRVRVMHNRDVVWPQDATWADLREDADVQIEFSCALSSGDRLTFILDSPSGDAVHAAWDPILTFVPLAERDVGAASATPPTWTAEVSGFVEVGGWLARTSAAGSAPRIRVEHRSTTGETATEWIQLDDCAGVPISIVLAADNGDVVTVAPDPEHAREGSVLYELSLSTYPDSRTTKE